MLPEQITNRFSRLDNPGFWDDFPAKTISDCVQYAEFERGPICSRLMRIKIFVRVALGRNVLGVMP